MARFPGETHEVFVIDAPIEEAKAHFSNLEMVAKNNRAVQSHTIEGDQLRLILEPKSAGGVTFEATYTCRYVFVNENTLEWETIESSKIWSSGRAIFSELGSHKTRVDYLQEIELELDVHRLLAKMIKPIIARQLREGVREYLQNMTKSLVRA